MTEDVKADVIKGTQDVLGKYIKKPILTEKLLKKPPFRFLHDICTSVMKETGFLVAVLNAPEDKIENIKDKDGKIAFLQKVIAAVEAANGVKLTVKPTKIVAGLEPTKTNELLQALGKAIKKQQVDSKNVKAQVAKTKTSRSHSKDSKEDHQEKKHSTSKTSKQIVENGTTEPSESKKGSNRHSSISPDKRTSSKKSKEDITPRAQEKRHRDKKVREPSLTNGTEPTDTGKSVPVVEPPPPPPAAAAAAAAISSSSSAATAEPEPARKSTEPTNETGAGESVDVRNSDAVTVNGTEGQGDHVVGDVPLEKESRRKHTGKQRHRRSSISAASADQTKPTESENVDHDETATERTETKENKISEKISFVNKPDPVVGVPEQPRSTPSPGGQLNYTKKDFVQREGTLISRPKTGIRPTTARPASARPAAPRIRERGDVPAVEETKKPTGKVNVIVDKDVNNEIEDDNLISLETTNDILLDEMTMPEPTSVGPAAGQGEHGHLVEQILEVQKELEDNSRLTGPEEKTTTEKTEIEWEFGRNAELVSREIEKLRGNIQTLTRSANPLGKLLDFFQEDVDTIQRELESWQNRNASLAMEIAHEKSITEQFVEPLKIHLKEIQQSIDEQFEQISLVKANIIRNNQKIQKLLAGM